jgi:hypothetical protein
VNGQDEPQVDQDGKRCGFYQSKFFYQSVDFGKPGSLNGPRVTYVGRRERGPRRPGGVLSPLKNDALESGRDPVAVQDGDRLLPLGRRFIP